MPDIKTVTFVATPTESNQGSTVPGQMNRNIYYAEYVALTSGGISGQMVILTLSNRYGTSNAVVDQAVLLGNDPRSIKKLDGNQPVFKFRGSGSIRSAISGSNISGVLCTLSYKDEERNIQ